MQQMDRSAAPNAFEQTAFELVLEGTYLLADSRLRNKVSLGGERKTFEVNQVAEHFQGFNVHLFDKRGCLIPAIFFILSYLKIGIS